MPKLKRLLMSACFETAQRRRQCSRNKGHKIFQGDRCLVIKENRTEHSYCMECAQLILDKAREDLKGLMRELDTNG